MRKDNSTPQLHITFRLYDDFLPPRQTTVVHGRTTAWSKFFIIVIYNKCFTPIFTKTVTGIFCVTFIFSDL